MKITHDELEEIREILCEKTEQSLLATIVELNDDQVDFRVVRTGEYKTNIMLLAMTIAALATNEKKSLENVGSDLNEAMAALKGYTSLKEELQ